MSNPFSTPLKAMRFGFIGGFAFAFWFGYEQSGGKVWAGLLTAVVPYMLLVLGGVFNLMNERQGIPVFRRSFWAGRYVEPPRPPPCPTCGRRR